MTTPGLPGTPWGTPGAPNLPFVPAPQDVPGVASVLELGESLGAVRRWVSDRHNWVRVAWFVGGSFLILAGVGMLGGKPVATGVTKIVDKVL